ncbi:MAG: class I SAM-dependent methyltransferase [Dehalococcoidia bacterium]
MYDRFMARTERRVLGAKRRELLAGIRGDVLEIGAGTGANFAHYPPEARVTATDPDPYMLRRAESKRTSAIVDLREAPAEKLPFPDASFDAVVCTISLCTVQDQRASLGEIRRVLRPGGEYRFIEHVRPEGLFGRLLDVVQPVYGWVSAGCHANRRTEQAMRDAGFGIARIDHFRLNGAPAISGVAKWRRAARDRGRPRGDAAATRRRLRRPYRRLRRRAGHP